MIETYMLLAGIRIHMHWLPQLSPERVGVVVKKEFSMLRYNVVQANLIRIVQLSVAINNH